MTAALIEGIQAGKIFPVFCGSAKQNIGVKKLMNGMVEYMPTPYFHVAIGMDTKDGDLKERHTEDAFSAQVFKTIVDPFVGRMSYMRIFSGTMIQILYNPQCVGNCIMGFFAFDIDNCTDTAVIMFKFLTVKSLPFLYHFFHFPHPFYC